MLLSPLLQTPQVVLRFPNATEEVAAIDTGATVCTISQATAERVGLRPTPHYSEIVLADGTSRGIQIHVADSLSLQAPSEEQFSAPAQVSVPKRTEVWFAVLPGVTPTLLGMNVLQDCTLAFHGPGRAYSLSSTATGLAKVPHRMVDVLHYPHRAP